MSTGTGGAFRIGQVLATGCSVVLRNFPLFFVLAFVANVPNLVLDYMAPPQPPAWMDAVAPGVEAAPVTSALRALSPWIVGPLALAGIALSFVLSAAATYLMIADLRRTPFALGEALMSGLRALLPLLGVVILLSLMLLGFGLVIGLAWAGIAFGLLDNPKSPLGVLLLPVFVIPVVIVALRLSLIVPVVVVERAGPVTAMQRSAELTKGSLWPIFGALVLVGLIFVGINVVVFGAGFLAFGLKSFFHPIAIVAGHAIVSAEVPFYWAVVAVLYYYLRLASEPAAETT